MRILLIEDDSLLSELLQGSLSQKDFTIDQAYSGKEGLELFSLYSYSAIILDLGLPDMKGSAVLQSLRTQNTETPIIILSGREEVEARLQMLELGADDYILKPFITDELVARLHANIRRASGYGQNKMEIGDLTLNIRDQSVSIKNQDIALTRKEYEMLQLLCLKKGGVVSKAKFLDHLYSGMDEPEVKIIDVFICKLRKKLEAIGNDAPKIETVWGRGYRIQIPAQ